MAAKSKITAENLADIRWLFTSVGNAIGYADKTGQAPLRVPKFTQKAILALMEISESSLAIDDDIEFAQQLRCERFDYFYIEGLEWILDKTENHNRDYRVQIWLDRLDSYLKSQGHNLGKGMRSKFLKAFVSDKAPSVGRGIVVGDLLATAFPENSPGCNRQSSRLRRIEKKKKQEFSPSVFSHENRSLALAALKPNKRMIEHYLKTGQPEDLQSSWDFSE